MSEEISVFIKAAQLLPVSAAVNALGLKLPKKVDQGGPCPRCGGKDRFAVNLAKDAWVCRGCDAGGRNGLSLVAHVLKYDLHSRSELLEASAFLSGKPVPDGAERETAAARARREASLQLDLQKAESDAAERQKKQDAFREKEVRKARGIYLGATVAPHEDDRTLREYLRLRTGCVIPDTVFENIRFAARRTYWHGNDERGNPVSHYVGYAMIAPFVDAAGKITGCHETWIDLSNGPKYRPDLGRDNEDIPLPTKKMRGTKKGSLIPVCGDLPSTRWVGGEGIETVLAFAGFDGFRSDTFYFATGDLGNLAGPADPKSAFNHPSQKVTDKRGRSRPVRVPGIVPKPGQSTSDAYQVPRHVDDLIHLADGDSEVVFTVAAMKRAAVRCALEGRSIHTLWPPAGADFASLGAEKLALGN
ncbi:DUF7146 domain-containing protein [Neorhizobium sp. DAR64861/K0K2]|uniref:DUF7146 domain-containing protein n=1 Tax=unclassified Neorhizobium TaxID=2629175 RepID=UPI003D265ECD